MSELTTLDLARDLLADLKALECGWGSPQPGVHLCAAAACRRAVAAEKQVRQLGELLLLAIHYAEGQSPPWRRPEWVEQAKVALFLACPGNSLPSTKQPSADKGGTQ